MKWSGLSPEKIKTVCRKHWFLLLLLAVATALLVMPVQTKQLAQQPSETSREDTVKQTEDKLSAMLSSMEGCGEAHVMLTLKSTGTKTLAQSCEESFRDENQSEVTTEPLVIRSGSNTEQVVVTAQTLPQYQGALVVCQGGDDPRVQLTVTQAVHALTGLGSDKITVTKMTEGTK